MARGRGRRNNPAGSNSSSAYNSDSDSGSTGGGGPGWRFYDAANVLGPRATAPDGSGNAVGGPEALWNEEELRGQVHATWRAVATSIMMHDGARDDDYTGNFLQAFAQAMQNATERPGPMNDQMYRDLVGPCRIVVEAIFKYECFKLGIDLNRPNGQPKMFRDFLSDVKGQNFDAHPYATGVQRIANSLMHPPRPGQALVAPVNAAYIALAYAAAVINRHDRELNGSRHDFHQLKRNLEAAHEVAEREAKQRRNDLEQTSAAMAGANLAAAQANLASMRIQKLAAQTAADNAKAREQQAQADAARADNLAAATQRELLQARQAVADAERARTQAEADRIRARTEADRVHAEAARRADAEAAAAHATAAAALAAERLAAASAFEAEKRREADAQAAVTNRAKAEAESLAAATQRELLQARWAVADAERARTQAEADKIRARTEADQVHADAARRADAEAAAAHAATAAALAGERLAAARAIEAEKQREADAQAAVTNRAKAEAARAQRELEDAKFRVREAERQILEFRRLEHQAARMRLRLQVGGLLAMVTESRSGKSFRWYLALCALLHFLATVASLHATIRFKRIDGAGAARGGALAMVLVCGFLWCISMAGLVVAATRARRLRQKYSAGAADVEAPGHPRPPGVPAANKVVAVAAAQHPHPYDPTQPPPQHYPPPPLPWQPQQEQQAESAMDMSWWADAMWSWEGWEKCGLGAASVLCSSPVISSLFIPFTYFWDLLLGRKVDGLLPRLLPGMCAMRLCVSMCYMQAVVQCFPVFACACYALHRAEECRKAASSKSSSWYGSTGAASHYCDASGRAAAQFAVAACLLAWLSTFGLWAWHMSLPVRLFDFSRSVTYGVSRSGEMIQAMLLGGVAIILSPFICLGMCCGGEACNHRDGKDSKLGVVIAGVLLLGVIVVIGYVFTRA